MSRKMKSVVTPEVQTEVPVGSNLAELLEFVRGAIGHYGCIPIEERITKTQQETFTKQTPKGAKNVIVEGHVHEWINPDSPSETPAEFLKLPHEAKRA